jgi:hypothetical protein
MGPLSNFRRIDQDHKPFFRPRLTNPMSLLGPLPSNRLPKNPGLFVLPASEEENLPFFPIHAGSLEALRVTRPEAVVLLAE